VLTLLALHAVLGSAILVAGGRLGRRAVMPALIAPGAALIWVVVQLPAVTDGEVITQSVSWVPGLGLDVDLRFDAFTALMALVVTGVAVLVLVYSARYLPSVGEEVGRLVGLLVLFAGAMLGLIVADNLLLLYTCWELTSVTSYLLIGNHDREARARAAALQALLVTSTGGFAMLAGFVLIGQAAGTFDLSAIVADPPSGTTVSVGLVLVVVGAAAKSAQYPLHSWLPSAMVAPTPVSAYLHSAAMVKAGIYLIARLAPAFATTSIWRPLIEIVGLLTAVLAGLRALRQHDLKLLLAFSTVSQLGLLFVLFGVGTPKAAMAACALLLAHAAYKAALFLVVGILDHETGTRDMRALPGLGPGWRVVVIVILVSAASMAGVPFAFGFVAKEAALDAFARNGIPASTLILALFTVATALTVAYSLRFAWGSLTAGATDWASAPPPVTIERSPSVVLVAPASVLAGVSAVLGIVPRIADPLVTAATQALYPGATLPHLALWHGYTTALALSLAALAIGWLLFVARGRVARVLAVGRRIPSGARVYLGTLRGINTIADRVTSAVQTGSLPFYAGVILLAAALGPGLVLLTSDVWTRWPEVVSSPAHLPLVVLLVGGAIGAARARRRLVAVIFLSTVGYGMAGLFVVNGAPDLALTQAAIETLTTVLFVLVLRNLPGRFGRRPPVGRPVRLLVAGLVGLLVFGFAMAASQIGPDPTVSEEMVAEALPEGDGRNVVNVILVDMRALDTLGEITVLAVAAVGAVALARAGRRRRRPPAASPEAPPEAPPEIPTGETASRVPV